MYRPPGPLPGPAPLRGRGGTFPGLAGVSKRQYSSKANEDFQRPRGRVNCQTRAPGAPRARDAWRKFTEIYGIPRGGAAREPCIDFAAAKNTVQIMHNNTDNILSIILYYTVLYTKKY
jgi:hypothetical protein